MEEVLGCGSSPDLTLTSELEDELGRTPWSKKSEEPHVYDGVMRNGR